MLSDLSPSKILYVNMFLDGADDFVPIFSPWRRALLCTDVAARGLAVDAVDLVISTDGAGAVYKTLTLSFAGADGPQWKHLLASAVDGRRVSGDLATFRSEALARRFASEISEEPPTDLLKHYYSMIANWLKRRS